MSRSSVVILALALLGLSLPAQALSIAHVEPRRMESYAFTRFGALLGHQDTQDPTRLSVMTDPKSATGLYFVTHLDTRARDIPAGTVAVLELLTEGDRAAQVFKFPLPATTSRAKDLYLGLTNEPFNTINKREMPRILAWRVSLQDKDGKELSASASPMWQY